MRVIKPGREQKGWSKVCVCKGTDDKDERGGCGAELLVEEADLFLTMSGGSYCEPPDTRHATFRCMACGVRTDVTGVPAYAFPKFKEGERNRCPVCRGTGYGDAGKCGGCKGTGKMEYQL